MSLLISASAVACLFFIYTRLFSQDSSNISNILIVSALIIFLLLSTVLVLGALLSSRIKVEHSQAKELNSFKDFTDTLHRSASEAEVYEVLFKFVSRIPLIHHASLYYPAEKFSENDVWHKLGNENIPVCNMNSRTCPVVKNRKECLVRDIQHDIKCAYQYPEHKRGSYLCLPIIDSGYLEGVVQAYSRSSDAFDETTVTKLISYIEMAKSVLNSRKALNILNKKAHTDKLTKLYNRSFLEPYLENQMEVAALSEQHLSVIMVDIDHFKKINDTYGHAAGDHVLTFFSELLLRCTRKTDLVSRYGGEEFLIVLPSTTVETAVSIAERIRNTVSETYIPPMDGTVIPSITCSLGISTYPVHCDTKHSLVKTSDAALYKAKQSGRNCVRVHGQ